MAPTDSRSQQARQAHRAAQKAEDTAARHRVLRNRALHDLRKSDPKYYTHERLAKIIDCSAELVAHILRQPRP